MTFKIMFGFQKIYEKYYSKENGKEKKINEKKNVNSKLINYFYILLYFTYFNFNI